MGREAAQEYERLEAVDTDPVLTARVRRIGTRLIAVAEATEYPFEFHAVDTNEINAFALPGGFVYLFRGLAQLLPGDDALAFILAHEISHVTQHHGVRQMEKSLAVGTLLNFTLHPGTTSGLVQLVIDMHYSRHDEAEADRLGLALMAKAGFDPAQGPEAMAVIARVAKAEHSIPGLLRSHPLPESRIAALRREAAALRAAPRPERKIAAAPALPKPAAPAPPPAPLARSDLFPLQVGMRWTYRVTDAATAPSPPGPGEQAGAEFTTSVLEEQPGLPGAFRVRLALEGGLATTRLLAVTAAGVCVWGQVPREEQGRDTEGKPQAAGGSEAGRPLSPEPSPAIQLPADASRPAPPGWQMEISLPASLPPEGGDASWETVHVPAGEYRAARVAERTPGGETATVWLAPGVGVVRRSWERSGIVEELKSFHRPAPEDDRAEGPKADAGTPPVRPADPGSGGDTARKAEASSKPR